VRIGDCANRTVADEFGAPMTTGLNYNVPTPDDNFGQLHPGRHRHLPRARMGSVYWPGLRTDDTYSIQTLTGDAARPWLVTTNQSGADRLAWAWGRGKPVALPLAESSLSRLRRSAIVEQKPGEAESTPRNQPQEADQLREILRRPEYLRALVFCAVIGILVSLAAFWFLVLLHEMESLIWVDWPHDLGWATPPWWWPLPLALVSGAVVALVVLRFPGRGGHIPAGGLHAGGASKAAVPGVAVAALASLPLGAVLGPEAPLIALGGGLALVFRDLVRAPATESSTALLGAAGAAAAISTIFGNPLVAAVLLMEVAGVGGPQLFVVMLPALLAGGVGAIVFTGFGHWTGLDAESLNIGLPAPPTLDLGDVVWSTLMAVVLGAAIHWIIMGGRVAARFVSGHVVRNTMLCALAAGGCATLYAVITGRSPAEVSLSSETVPSSAVCSRVVAAMMRERWVNACGKLPSCSPLGPISSANRPTWFAYVCIFSKV
jgi:hypothetical protein